MTILNMMFILLGVQLLQDHIHDNVYKKALQDTEHIVNLQVFRMVLCGVPRSGKTTFWKRIAIKDFKPSPESASTGVAESHFFSVAGREKQESHVHTEREKQESDQAHVHTEREKQESDRAHMHTEMLFDLHLYSKDSDLNSEALAIYKLILERHTKTKSENLKAYNSNPTTDNGNPQSDDKRKGPSAQNVSHSAKPNPSTQNKSPSEEQLPDPIITEINEKIDELDLQLKGKDLPDLPNNIIKKMCHLQDTGGQRAFLELLPTLSTGKALYLIFFNYQSFEKSVSETRQAEGSPKEWHTGIEYKQIDIIMQSLICVLTASEPTDKRQSTNNIALLVGTHVDEFNYEEIKRVDEIILKRVIPFIKERRLAYANSTKNTLVLQVAINKTDLCSNKPEDYVSVIMDIMDNKIESRESEELPASWYMFCIMLRRLQNAGYSVLRYSHCERIAEKLYIPQSELKSALFRLQNVFGIVLYFPEVEALKDIVICDPAFVYKRISELIFESFCGHFEVPLRKELQKHGIFKYSELEKKHEIKQGLELSKLTILLKHLGIIAPINRSDTKYENDSDNEDINPDQEYVIPCVLKEAKQYELNVQLENSQACSIVPLRIYFDCEFAPMGGFCYLFTKVISNNKGWKLCTPDKWEDENNIYWQNKITLEVEYDSHIYFVTLLSTDTYYEIHIIHSMSEPPFNLQNVGHSICKHVWEAIHTVLEKSPNKPLQAYKVACICTIATKATDKHVMEFKCKPHENSSKVKAYCKECKRYADLDTQPSVVVWFKVRYYCN